jgi:tetratricopeptide (TPR) repeat protein
MKEKVVSVLACWRGARRCGVTIVCITALLSACGGESSQDPAALLAMAKALHTQGDTGEPTILLKNVLQQEPDNVEARWELGKVYFEAGAYLSAVSEWIKGRDSGLKHPDLAYLMATAAIAAGDLLASVPEILPATLIRGDARLLAIRARAHFAAGDLSEAAEYLAAAQALDPEQAEVLFAQMATAEDGTAALLARVLQAEPGHYEAKLTEAIMLASDGKSEEATAIFKALVEQRPYDFRVRGGLARSFLEQGDVDGGREQVLWLERNVAGSPTTKYLSGYLAFVDGDIRLATARFEQAVSDSPRYYEPLRALADIYAKQGSVNRAIAYYGRALTVTPQDGEARMRLAGLLRDTGDNVRAARVLASGVRYHGGSQGYLTLAGEAAVRAGDFSLGTKLLEAAASDEQVADADNNAASVRKLGRVYLAQGRRDDAADLFLKTVNDKPGEPNPRKELVEFYRAVDDADAARATAKKFVLDFPDSALAHVTFGRVMEDAGERNGAGAAYERAIALDPAYGPALAHLGRWYVREGRRPEAIAIYRQMVTKKVEGWTEAALNLAGVISDRGQARQYLDQALEHDPNDIRALYMRARLDMFEKRIVVAREQLEKARGISPNYLDVLALLASAYLAEERFADALSTADAGLNLNEDHVGLLISRASAAWKLGKFAIAVDSYERLVRLTPERPDFIFQLARTQIALGELVKAKGTTVKLRTRFGESVQFFLLSGRLALAGAEFEKGAELAEAGLSIDKDNADLLELAGDLNVALQRYTKAGDHLRRAHAVRPSSLTLEKMVRARIGAGVDDPYLPFKDELSASPNHRETKARFAAVYQQLLEANANDLLALNNLAWLYFEDGQSDKARPLAERAYALGPNNPSVLSTFGAILSASGSHERALSLLARSVESAPGNGSRSYEYARGLLRAGQLSQARALLVKIVQGGKPGNGVRAKAQSLLDRS